MKTRKNKKQDGREVDVVRHYGKGGRSLGK